MSAGSLAYLKQEASQLPYDYRAICGVVLNDPRFAEGFGGSDHHHGWKGGLADHVADVVRRCKELANSETVDWRILLTAAIWHDYHKIYEYSWDEEQQKVKKLPYRTRTGHVVGSWREFVNTAERDFTLPADVIERIGNAMLAHHGRREWGSPVEPQTNEAWILHSADMQSSGH